MIGGRWVVGLMVGGRLVGGSVVGGFNKTLQKSHEEFGQLQTSTGKSKKLKFDGPLSSKKKFVQKIHYVQRIKLSTTCVKIYQITYVISFLTAQLLRIFLAQTLHTFYKSIPKVKVH